MPLGKESLFQKLEAESALAGDTHRLPEITDEAIGTAMKEPPPGRASHRAVLIRKYRNLPEYEISWDLLFDLKLRRRLEIPQALHWDGEEAWKEDAKNIYTTCKTAATLFRQGEFVKVFQLLDPAFASADFFLRERAYSDLCLSYARLGMKDHVEKILEANKGRYFGSPFEESVFVLFCAVNYGLCPPLNILEPLIKQCESLRAERQSDTYTVGHDDFVFQQNKAVVLLGKGDATGAEQLCRTLLIPRENLTRTRMTARTRCHLAKALYAQGRLDEAREALLPASKCHADERLWWDMAAQSLPLEALLTDDHEHARTLLDKAEALHRSQRNPLGLAKILCLKARIFQKADAFREFKQLCVRTSALHDCPLATRILRDWKTWTQGPSASHTAADWWGL